MRMNQLSGAATLLLAYGMLFPRLTLAENQPDIKALTDQLRGQSAAGRYAAIEALAGLGPAAKPAVTELAKLLSDSDPLARVLTASALARIEPENAKTVKRAVDVLGVVLRKGDSRIRPEAESGLVAIGRPAVPTLLTALTDPNAEVRRSAASALVPQVGNSVP